MSIKLLKQANLSAYLILAGVLVIAVSTLLPWYHWQVDATPLTQKLEQIDPATVAKLAPGMSSAQDVLATYGGIGSEALNDSVNLWSLWRFPSLMLVASALITVIMAAIVGIAISMLGKDGNGGGGVKRLIFSTRLLVLAMSLVVGLSLAAFWPAMGRAATGWQARHPAPNETTAAWRQEAAGQGYFSVGEGSAYGYWVAAAGAAVLILGAGLKVVGGAQAHAGSSAPSFLRPR